VGANFSTTTTCNVTADASPTVADVQSAINQALGLSQGAGDINYDGVVNVVEPKANAIMVGLDAKAKAADR